jgi:hypothetical protein
MKNKNEGIVVIVNGEIVAWFANFNISAQEWCRDNYYGQWLAIPGIKPKISPLTEEEVVRAEKAADEFLSLINSIGSETPEPPPPPPKRVLAEDMFSNLAKVFSKR